MTGQVFMYRRGICMASVCAPKETPIGEVESQINRSDPTGIDSPWRLDESDTFSGGQSNPCTCEQDPSRVHWLLSC